MSGGCCVWGVCEARRPPKVIKLANEDLCDVRSALVTWVRGATGDSPIPPAPEKKEGPEPIFDARSEPRRLVSVE